MRYFRFFLFLLPFFVSSQVENNFYLIINDPKMTSQDVKKMVDIIYLNADLKLTQFKVIHYTNKPEITESWVTKKKSVEYKPTKINCDFNINENVYAIVSIVKTQRTKFYMCEKQLSCDFQNLGVESSLLVNKYESTIKDKIIEELALNKTFKKKQTIFFYIENNIINTKPTVQFTEEYITIKDTETYKLSPIIKGCVASYEWTPSDGLNCSDCKSPTVKTEINKIYKLIVKDSLGCFSFPKTISINIEKSCICDKDMQKTEILLGKLPIKKYEKRKTKTIAKWDWRIVSNQSGGYVFDLVCNSVCSKKYLLIVRKSNGESIYEDFYNVEQVDKRSKNDYHLAYPDNFVFRLDLTQQSDFLNDEEEYFNVEIVSVDENNNECLDKKYISPKIRFTKCN